MSKTCAITGCENELKATFHLMCRDHWYQVPVSLRVLIWDLYRRERGSKQHVKACAEAIRRVEGRQHAGA